MRAALYCALVAALAGCSHHRATSQTLDDQLVGKSVADALSAVDLHLGKYWVVDEPPGIARAVEGTLPSGARMRLYVHRGDLPFRGDLNWKIAEFKRLIVRGVARFEGGKWIVHGETMLTQPKD